MTFEGDCPIANAIPNTSLSVHLSEIKDWGLVFKHETKMHFSQVQM